MFDTENSDKVAPGERPRRSLLSLASSSDRVEPSVAAAGEAGDKRPDAAALHRQARARREARPSPLMAALAEGSEPAAGTKGPQSVVRDAPERSWADRLTGRIKAALNPPPEPGRVSHAAATAVPQDQDNQTADRSSNGHDGFSSDVNDRQTWRPLIDPTAVIMGVGRSKALILSTTILGALIGVAIALSTPKKYESAAELLIDPRDLQLVDRNLTEGGLPSDATLAIVENQVRVITSGTVLNKVVDQLNLAEDPEFNGQRQNLGIGTIIDGLRSLISSNGGWGGDRRRALAVQGLAESLSVERGGRTFVVVVAVTTEEPEKSALIANTVTQVFLETYGKLQSNTAERATNELTSRLDELRASVEKAERGVEAYKAENDLIDAQGRLISDDEIVKLNEQLSLARARTAELNAKAASTRGAGPDLAINGVLPEELSSNVMVELRSQYASLKREADRLSVRLGPRHPQRMTVDTELEGLRGEIAAELRRIVSSVQVELRRAVQLEQELAARLAQMKVRQGGVSDDLVTLRELEREAAAKRAVYESYLLRARETGEQKDINTANMSVISQAYPPLESVGPSRAVVSVTGMMLGFLAGIALGALRGAVSSVRTTVANRRQGRRPPTAAPVRPHSPVPPSSPAPVQNVASPESVPPSSPMPPQAETKPMFSMLEKVLRSSKKPSQADKSADDRAAPSSVATPYAPMGAPMAQQAAPQYPQGSYTPHYPYPPQAYAPMQAGPAMYAPPYAAAPAQPYPYQPMPVQMMWHPAGQPMGPQPMAQYMGQHPPHTPMQPYPQPTDPYFNQHATSAEADRLRSEIDGVRESLREFREAVRDLSDNRRRRAF